MTLTDCDGNDCEACEYEYTVLVAGEPPDFYGRVPAHRDGCEQFDALASVWRQRAPIGIDCDDGPGDTWARWLADLDCDGVELTTDNDTTEKG